LIFLFFSFFCHTLLFSFILFNCGTVLDRYLPNRYHLYTCKTVYNKQFTYYLLTYLLYFSAFLAKKRAYICAYFLHFSVHIIRALFITLKGWLDHQGAKWRGQLKKEAGTNTRRRKCMLSYLQPSSFIQGYSK
jgi:hypothetical protein